MSDIEVQHGRIVVGIAEHYDEPEHMTPAEARETAARLIAAAEECEQDQAKIVAACADGHLWGSYNGYQGRDMEVTVQWCRRNGCDAREVLPGWMHFAGLPHIEPISGRDIACTGPGCDVCNAEKFGSAVNALFTKALAALVPPTLGGAFATATIETA